jgi:asparagine synthetase B (glutamine-hydrolysing)
MGVKKISVDACNVRSGLTQGPCRGRKWIHIQPMPFINGYGAIQKELEQRGHWLRTRSDSEIASHLYEECGAACLQRLRDEFAIALWDQPNQSLFAARDRFDIKPLFYAQHEGALYLASEVKALFAAAFPRVGIARLFITPWSSVAIRRARSSTMFFRFPPATIWWRTHLCCCSRHHTIFRRAVEITHPSSLKLQLWQPGFLLVPLRSIIECARQASK